MTSTQLSELLSYLDKQPKPSIVMNEQYVILGANATYLEQFADTQPLTGRCCYEVSHHFDRPCDESGEACPLKLSKQTGLTQRVLHLHHTPRGEEHVDVELTPIYNQQGELVGFVETMETVAHASAKASSHGLVGRSAAFNHVVSLIKRAAPSNAAILLLGESGTGKELAAQAIHNESPRANKPFVAVDCSGLTESLFESELFGYEKGAFTGANQRKLGLVESAKGGTLFLDEIGDIPLNLQVKLLRLLETGTYRRVGGVEPLRADFRLISATHRDLTKMVKDETFRRDLYYRISTFPIRLPALSERREDIQLLVESLLARISPHKVLTVHSKVLNALCNYDFPGNIRELRNILERASLLADGGVIMPEHLIMEDTLSNPRQPASKHETVLQTTVVTLEQAERDYIKWAEQYFDGEKKDLAKLLGVSERTLYRKLQD